MKTVKFLLAVLALAFTFLVATSCTKTKTVPPVAQPTISIVVAPKTTSVINAVRIDSNYVSDDISFPLASDHEVVVESRVADSATINVYISYVKGETVVFVDSYGNTR